MRNRLRVVLPAVVIACVLAAGALAPLLAPYGPLEQHTSHALEGPSSQFLLGTDQFGRDILSRLIYGARAELEVSLGATAIAVTLGVPMGLLGGYFSGLSELLTLRLADIILAFPPIVAALLIVTLTGPGVITLIVIIGVLYTPLFARITNSQVTSIRRMEYVESVKALGARPLRVMFRTVLMNSLAPIIVQCSLSIAAAILLESGLSFLGLGVVPPEPSWGLMVAEARRYMATDPYFLLMPSVTITVTILAFSLLGDYLRDQLDPRLRGTMDKVPAGT